MVTHIQSCAAQTATRLPLRTGFLLSSELSWLTIPVGALLALSCTSAGFLLQTHALKMGATVPVCVCTTAASMVSGAWHVGNAAALGNNCYIGSCLCHAVSLHCPWQT